MNISDLIAYIDAKLADNHKRLIIPSVHRDVLHYLVNGLNATVFNINSSQVTDNGDGTYTITVTNPLDDALAIDEKLTFYEFDGTAWTLKFAGLGDFIASASDNGDDTYTFTSFDGSTNFTIAIPILSVEAGPGIDVDVSDPKRPSVGLDQATQDFIGSIDFSTGIHFMPTEQTMFAGNGNVLISKYSVAQLRNRILSGNLQTLVGGYDNELNGGVANGILSSQHSSITGLASHALITGGSNNKIPSGNYALIAGGSNNEIQSNGDFSSIIGGRFGVINAVYAAIISALNGQVDSNYSVILGGSGLKIYGGGYSAIVAGSDNQILETAGGYNAILSGINNVISGTRSAIVSGSGNILSSADAVIICGSTNVMSGNRSAIIGGHENEVTGNNSTVFAGKNIQISGTYSSGTGSDNIVSADFALVSGEGSSAVSKYSKASGLNAVSRVLGADTISNGKFTNNGDCQTFVVHLGKLTTNATPTPIRPTTLGFTSMTISAGHAWAINALVIATDGVDTASFKIEGCVSDVSGTLQVVGAPSVVSLGATSGASTWSTSLTVNDSTKEVIVNAIGEAAKDIRWSVRFQAAEVGWVS